MPFHFIYRRYYLITDILFYWVLRSFCPLFWSDPWAFSIRIVLQIYQLWLGAPWSTILCILTSVDFYDVSILCKKKLFWWGVETTFICRYKDTYWKDCSWEVYKFGKDKSRFSSTVHDLIILRWFAPTIFLSLFSSMFQKLWREEWYDIAVSFRADHSIVSYILCVE